jgi:hypothetical protein
MSDETVTIPARLVAYLRRGVQAQLGACVETLAVALEGEIDESRYQEALADFDAARALLDAIGVGGGGAHADLELDLRASGELVLKALEAQHRSEVARLQDAHAAGVRIPSREVPELGRLVAKVRKEVCGSEALRRADALLESRGALKLCRSRDHG